MRFSKEEAKRFAIHHLGLDGSWELAPGIDGAYEAINRLGYLQIDTISVVARAHQHVLWTRYPDASQATLDELQRQARIFEFWGPANSYLPIHVYRYCQRQMAANKENKRTMRFEQEHPGLMDQVLGRIRDEGPLGSVDFKAPANFDAGAWWNWKPAKQALDRLFNQGDLAVAERRGFQRRYDLTERVLPADLDLTPPSPEEEADFRLDWAMRRIGIGGVKALWEVRIPRNLIKLGIERAVSRGTLLPVTVDGLDRDDYYMRAQDLTDWQSRSWPEPTGARLLNPFEPLVQDRIWHEDLFGFYYRLECYTPAPKRIHGYFSLPILWGTRMVARADCKADRKPKTFIVRNLVAEASLADSEREPFCVDLAQELWRYARHNGCERIVVEAAEPPALVPMLREAVEATS